MKRFLLVFLMVCFLIPSPLFSAAINSEAITVSSTAIGITASLLSSGTTRAQKSEGLCTVESNQIRYRVDGSNPTTSVGHVADPGDIIHLEGLSELVNFRAIRTSADAKLYCTVW